MSAGNKLIRQLTRREKGIQKHAKNKDRIDLAIKVMEKGRGVKSLMRGAQRRYDKTMGKDTVAKKPIAGVVDLSVTIDRFDFDPGAGVDFGIRVTFTSAALETWSGVQAGDVVKIRSGQLAGRELDVISVIDATHIRLFDVASFTGTEVGDIINVYNSTARKAKLGV